MILTGYSATGKSTLTKQFEKQGFGVLHPTAVLLEYLRTIGYDSTDEYYHDKGKENGFELRRQLTIKKVNQLLQSKNVIIEGLYDSKLLSRLSRTFGRKNIFVVGLSANQQFKLMTLRRRQESQKEALDKDRIKDKHGLSTILGKADLIVDVTKTPSSMANHVLNHYKRYFK